ncbi:MAG: PAS domain S-box protein [Xanthomonadales bacterium]|nr:PAS domain S-box protein [Xanthomonadales bacterium]
MKPQLEPQISHQDMVQALHAAKLGIISLDPDSDLFTMSAAARGLFGLGEADSSPTRDKFEQAIHPKDRERVNHALRDAKSGEEAIEFDYRVVLPDGELRWLRSHAKLKSNEEEPSGTLLCTVMDRTQHKLDEIASHDKNVFLRSVSNTLTDPMWLKDSGGKYVSCNREFERLVGARESEIVGKTDMDFFPAKDAGAYIEDDKYAMASGRPTMRQESITYSDDGHKERVEIIKAPLFSQDGALVGVMGVAHDISERKQHEAFSAFQTRRAGALLKLPEIAESLDEVSFIQQGLKIIEDLTRSKVSFLQIVGEDHQDIDVSVFSQRTLARCVANGPGQQPEGSMASVVDLQVINELYDDTEQAYLPRGFPQVQRLIEFPIEEDGKVVVIAGVANKQLEYSDLDVETVQLIVNDIWRIVQRQRTSFQLSKLAQAVEQSPESIVITDLSLNIEYTNSAFLKQTGYGAKELTGQNLEILKSGKTPEEAYGAMHRALERGRSFQGDFINRRKDGSEYIDSALMAPLRQSDGNITHYVGINSDVTEQKRIAAELESHRNHLEEVVEKRTEELVEAQERAETANQAKSEFLANMSHEIRTPMNAIIGLTHLLHNTQLSVEQAEGLSKINHSAGHLLSIINDILDISKIEAAKMSLENVPFKTDSLFESVQSILRDESRTKGLKLEIDIRDLPPWLDGDLTRLRQALLNYASNAVKFSKQGTVKLIGKALERKNGKILVRIEVRDTGIGIEADKLENLFQPFEQADTSTTRRYGGTGLGLIITRRLAELMGGKAGAESEPGVGSTFWFTAWLRPGVATEEALPEPGILDAGDYLKTHYQGASILLVEDNLINSEVATSLLTRVGLAVETAGNGLEAIEKVRTNPYDLILMDIQMPLCDGLEATRHIRAMATAENCVAARNSCIPILAMTANVFEEDRKACLRAGMVELIGKPVEPSKLYTKILKWIKGKKQPEKAKTASQKKVRTKKVRTPITLSA